MLNARDFSDPPFGCPPDIILDIPVPPSVNRTRRVDPAFAGAVAAWMKAADLQLMASGQYRIGKHWAALNGGRFELVIVLDELKCRLDADNPVKAAIDYLRRIELIKNDDKRYLRRLVVEWGFAPEGCRLVLRGAA